MCKETILGLQMAANGAIVGGVLVFVVLGMQIVINIRLGGVGSSKHAPPFAPGALRKASRYSGDWSIQRPVGLEMRDSVEPTVKTSVLPNNQSPLKQKLCMVKRADRRNSAIPE